MTAGLRTYFPTLASRPSTRKPRVPGTPLRKDGAPIFVPLLAKSRSFDYVPYGHFAQDDIAGVTPFAAVVCFIDW